MEGKCLVANDAEKKKITESYEKEELVTMSSSLRQAPKALVQFFLAAVNMVLRSEMSQVLPLMSTAAIARAASVQSSQEASPLAAIAGFVRLENVSMCISHSEIKVSL